MSLFNNHKAIVLVFNSTKSLDKKCRATVVSIDQHAVLIDISQAHISGMNWLRIAELLGCKVEALINKEHPRFKELYDDSDVELDDRDALKILHSHPDVLSHPVAVRNKKALLLKSRNEIYKLED